MSRGPLVLAVAIVCGYLTAHGYATMYGDVVHDSLQDIATHIVKKDIDPRWAKLCQALSHVLRSIVDSGINTADGAQPFTFDRSPGNPDHPAPFLIFAICAATDPTDPAAAEITTVSPGRGSPTLSKPK